MEVKNNIKIAWFPRFRSLATTPFGENSFLPHAYHVASLYYRAAAQVLITGFDRDWSPEWKRSNLALGLLESRAWARGPGLHASSFIPSSRQVGDQLKNLTILGACVHDGWATT
jgi:hypothetical protein